MPRRVDDFRGLTHLSRLRLLSAVQRLPGRRIDELADEADLHRNTAREHLAVMEREGLVRSVPVATGSRGRPPVEYHPVDDASESEPARERAKAARIRGDALRRAMPDLDATADLGSDATHQIDTLYEHLDDAGFEPELDEQALTIGLTPCRYLSVMSEDQQAVCAAHIRLVRSQLEQVSGPVELRQVSPFVTPTHCVIALGLRGEPTRSALPRGDHALRREAMEGETAAPPKTDDAAERD